MSDSSGTTRKTCQYLFNQMKNCVADERVTAVFCGNHPSVRSQLIRALVKASASGGGFNCDLTSKLNDEVEEDTEETLTYKFAVKHDER